MDSPKHRYDNLSYNHRQSPLVNLTKVFNMSSPATKPEATSFQHNCAPKMMNWRFSMKPTRVVTEITASGHSLNAIGARKTTNEHEEINMQSVGTRDEIEKKT